VSNFTKDEATGWAELFFLLRAIKMKHIGEIIRVQNTHKTTRLA
jgi:hypothetical protein